MRLRKKMVAFVIGVLIAVSPGAMGAFTPNDTYWDDDPATTEEDEDKQWTLEHIDIDRAWDPTSSSEFTNPGANTITVAVIDSGLCMSNLDLYKRLWVNPDDNDLDDFDNDDNGKIDDINGWDFFDDWDDTTNTKHEDNHPMDGWQSKPQVADHGTAVTGIIAAEIDNDRGVAGCADVSIMILKVWDTNHPFHWKYDSSDKPIYTGFLNQAIGEAIQYAIDEGADIIHMSLGSYTGNAVMKSKLESAYWDNNILIVASAGNSGSSPISFPARYDFVTAVGAVDQNNNRVQGTGWGSDYGPNLDLMAPSGPFFDASGGTPPDVTIYTTKGFHLEDEGDQPLNDFYEEYRWFSGTSGAAPHVTGAAALLWSVRPEMTNIQLQRLMSVTAYDLNTPGFDEQTGYGLIDVDGALKHINKFQDSWSESKAISPYDQASGCDEMFDYMMEIGPYGNTHIVYSPKGGSSHGLYYLNIDKSGANRYHSRIMNLGNAPFYELDLFVDVFGRCHVVLLFYTGSVYVVGYAYFYLDQWGDLATSTNYPSFLDTDSDPDKFKDVNIVCAEPGGELDSIFPIVGYLEKETSGDYLVRIVELNIFGCWDDDHTIDPVDSVESLELDVITFLFPSFVIIGYQSGTDGYIRYFDPWTDIFSPDSVIFTNQNGQTGIRLSTFSHTGLTSIVYHKPDKKNSYFRAWNTADFIEYTPLPQIGDDDYWGPLESDLSICTDLLEVNHIVWKEYNFVQDTYALKYASMTPLGHDYDAIKGTIIGVGTPFVSFERELIQFSDNELNHPIIRSFSHIMDFASDDELRILVFDQTDKEFVYMTSMSNFKHQNKIVSSLQDDRLQDIGLDEDGYVHMIWERYDSYAQTSRVHYNFWDENNQPVLNQDLTSNSELYIEGITQSYAPKLTVIQIDTGDTNVLLFWLGKDPSDRDCICYAQIKIVQAHQNYQFVVQPMKIKTYHKELEWYEVEFDTRNELVHIAYLGQDNVFNKQYINYLLMDPSTGNLDMEKILDILNGIDIDQIQFDLDPYNYPYIVFSKGYDVFLIHYEFDWDNLNIQLLFKKQKIHSYDPEPEGDGGHHPEIRIDNDIQVNSKLEIGNEHEVDHEYYNYRYFGWTEKNNRFVHIFIPLVDFNGILTGEIRYLKISMRDQTTFKIVIDSIIYTSLRSRFLDDYANMEVLMDDENRPYLVFRNRGGTDKICLIKIDNFGRVIMSETIMSQSYDEYMKDRNHPQIAYYYDKDQDKFNIAISWMEKSYSGSYHDIYLRRSLEFST